MDVRFIDPREAVLTASGYGLDAIGSLHGVKLARKHDEEDDGYRLRLIARLRGEIDADEFVFRAPQNAGQRWVRQAPE